MPLTRRGRTLLGTLMREHGEREGKERFYGGMASGAIPRPAMEAARPKGRVRRRRTGGR